MKIYCTVIISDAACGLANSISPQACLQHLADIPAPRGSGWWSESQLSHPPPSLPSSATHCFHYSLPPSPLTCAEQNLALGEILQRPCDLHQTRLREERRICNSQVKRSLFYACGEGERIAVIIVYKIAAIDFESVVELKEFDGALGWFYLIEFSKECWA